MLWLIAPLRGTFVNGAAAGASSQVEYGVRAMPGVTSHKFTWPRLLSALPVSRLLVTLALSSLLTTVLAQSVQAEVRVLTAQGEHRMGDRDTREDAVRLATEAAKRNALEQVATYLESVTVVTDLDITKDEIRTYTAGVVLVLDQQESTTLDGNTIVIRVDMTTQVDTDEVVEAIAGLKQHEEARVELVALMQEVEQLHQELDAANLALAQATTSEQAQAASLQRQEILSRVQSNAMVSQAWTDWVLVAPAINPYPWVGLAQVQALVNVAGRLNPNNPHVQVVQQAIATRPVPAPSQSPSRQASMPAHQALPQQPATARPVPPTLNELHQATPPRASMPIPAPFPSTVQPTTVPPSSRRLTDIRQLNPLFPSAQRSVPQAGQPTQPTDGSRRRAQQALSPTFQMPPPTSAPSSTMRSYLPGTPSAQTPLAVPPLAGRRLPPSINQIHPPMPHQVPRVPYMGSRGSGGGSQGGGGRGGGSRGGGRGGGGGRGR